MQNQYFVAKIYFFVYWGLYTVILIFFSKVRSITEFIARVAAIDQSYAWRKYHIVIILFIHYNSLSLFIMIFIFIYLFLMIYISFWINIFKINGTPIRTLRNAINKGILRICLNTQTPTTKKTYFLDKAGRF